jgi:hypothetical protein
MGGKNVSGIYKKNEVMLQSDENNFSFFFFGKKGEKKINQPNMLKLKIKCDTISVPQRIVVTAKSSK